MSDRMRGGRGVMALLVAILFSLPQLGCGDGPQEGSVGTEQGADSFYGDYVVLASWVARERGDQARRREGARAGARRRADGHVVRISLSEESFALTTESPMEKRSILLGYSALGKPAAEPAKLIMQFKSPMNEPTPDMVRLEATKEGEGSLLLALIPRSSPEGLLFFVVRKVGDPRIGEDDAALLAKSPAEVKYEVARTQMAIFGQAIDNYRLTNKKLPGSLEDLTKTDSRSPHPCIDEVPMDPWGNEYVYRLYDRTTYEIRSYGEDKVADTDDDVLWPRRE